MGMLVSVPGFSAMPTPAGSSLASSAAGTTMWGVRAGGPPADPGRSSSSVRREAGTDPRPREAPLWVQAASSRAEVNAGTNSAPR
jgi:hypothetical protein